MTRSDDPDQPNGAPSFLPGPKPMAPIPRYEPGSDTRLRDQLRGSTTTGSMIPVNDDPDNFSVAGVEGMIDRKKANIAAKLVDTDPDQALRVIRNWLLED
ncbi:hypothetical protein [Thalassospira australica]|uniref:hypothetical protein n=1 Tax=Thalassospira australica TaxID=1528106 RepID=UPI00068D74C3|nr:hypothetical protein [Thalassospira australica]